MKKRNERKLEPYDEDGNYNYDDPFPTVPLKMEVDFIECKNYDYEEPIPYTKFAKGADELLKSSRFRQSINFTLRIVFLSILHSIFSYSISRKNFMY